MEHSTADESDVVVADLPSTSGAHWANRDRERRSGERSAPFRRPPAVNSFHDAADTPDKWDAFAPSGTAGDPDAARTDAAWDAFDAGAAQQADQPVTQPEAPTVPRQVRRDATGPGRVPFGSLDPATTGSGRASFGVTDGPISGARPEPVSPAGPRAAAGAGADAAAAPHPAVLPRPAEPVRQADLPRRTAGRGSATGEIPSFADLRPAADEPFGTGQNGNDPFGAAQGTTEPFGSPGPTAAAPYDPWAAGDTPSPADGDVPGGIGDFISGPGRDIRPHRAGGDPPAQPVEHRRSRLVTAATVLLSAVVLLGGAVAGVTFFADGDQSITSVLKLGSGDGDDKVATAPLDGRTAAGFELIAATTKVTVRTQDLGDRLFRITSAGDSGTAPNPVLSGDRVQLLLSPDGDGASGNVEVLLSAKVTWGLRFVGGTDEQVVDVTGGKVSSIDIAGGSRRVDLRLSQPTGTVPVRVTGAVDELSVLSPADSPVRIKVDSGAKTVAAGDKTLRDVRPGSTLTPKGWKVPNRYDVDAASRVTLLTVRNAD